MKGGHYMSELSTKVLAFLRSNPNRKYTDDKLFPIVSSMDEAEKVIKELEECGYIVVNNDVVSSFQLI